MYFLHSTIDYFFSCVFSGIHQIAQEVPVWFVIHKCIAVAISVDNGGWEICQTS